ncbi:MAG: hypothetical protein KGL39_10490 [Patescibacteria group bacterium]|nr:hypothetical protein [Patescibacteria group bacterium]
MGTNDGHKWWAKPSAIKCVGSWCPNCRLKNEKACRTVIEHCTGKSFEKCKPKWLKKLELDGFNESLKLAFEYQGEQHYQIIKQWHKKGEEDLKKQQDRDALKAQRCRDHGIDLIVIPYNTPNKTIFIARALCGIFMSRLKQGREALAYRLSQFAKKPTKVSSVISDVVLDSIIP